MLMNNVETEKSENMVAKDIKIFQKIKKLVEYRKIYSKMQKKQNHFTNKD